MTSKPSPENEYTIGLWPTPDARDSHPESLNAGLRRMEKWGTWGLQTAALVATSSQQDSRANRFQPPENDKARMMTAISGRNLRGLFEKSDPASLWVRMCRESLVWKAALTGYSLTWKMRATPQGRSLFLLRLSAPTTGGTGSGLWPTTTALDRPNEGNVRLLRAQVMSGELDEDEAEAMLGKSVWEAQGKIPALFPTPQHHDHQAGDPKRVGRFGTKHGGRNLNDEVLLWPTPSKSDTEGSRTLPEGTTPTGQRPDGKKAQVGLPNVIETGTGMKLSARWVCALMGYPPGWLDLSASDSDPIGSRVSPASPPTSQTA